MITNKSFVVFTILFLPISILFLYFANWLADKLISVFCILPDFYQLLLIGIFVLIGHALVTTYAFLLLKFFSKKT